jgi:hypothetical protein
MSKSRISIKRDQKPKSTDDFFSNFEGDHETSMQNETEEKEQKKYTRQTFLISEFHLEKLKDFVHTKKSKEDYEYTQKQALENALDLLFESIDNIEKRPKGKS